MTTTMAGILGNVTEIFGTGMTMASTVGTTVAGNPLLLMFVVIPVVGLGIGIFKRLLNL